MPRTLLLVVAALALGSTAAAATAELLPRPDVLEPNVRFWARIYREVGSDAGLIHDSVHLDVVYELISLPRGISARAQERRVEKVKKGYRTILRQLARGKRTGLSARQERVLKAWPAGTRNATFRQAASNLRFQLGQADQFRAGLIRSGAWRDHIEEVLDQGHGTQRSVVDAGREGMDRERVQPTFAHRDWPPGRRMGPGYGMISDKRRKES